MIDDREVLALGDEIDPNLFEPLGAAFATMNRISPAQRDFFERTVKEMETDPYEKWKCTLVEARTRCDATGQYEVRSHCCRWVRPPRRLLLVTVASETVEEAWSRDAVRAARIQARGQRDREAAVGVPPRERHHPRFHLGGPGLRLLGVPQGARATQ